MVKKVQAADFCREWASRYRAQFPAEAGKSQFFTTHGGPSALRVIPTENR
jgi:hypothetical protein